MKHYPNRSHPRYRSRVRRLLEVSGPRGLRQTALPVKPVQTRQRTFTRAICIDFFGLCGSTLFDRGRVSSPRCVFEQLEALARRTKTLNEEGIFTRFRTLLLYPYSAAGQERIQAEASKIRASILEPKYHRGSRLTEHIAERSFQHSSLVTTLMGVVNVIEEWRRELGPDHPFLSFPNRFDVRFAAVNSQPCGLRVNGRFFTDTYLLAKTDRHSHRCPNDLAPVIELNAADRRDTLSFKGFCDHFRYLWDHAATVDYADVVRDDAGTVSVLPPDQVTFAETARRVLSFEKRADDEAALEDYQSRARRVMLRMCPPLKRFQSKEVAFIACSWRGQPSHPIPEAGTLQTLLHRDFNVSRNEAVQNGAGSRLGVCVMTVPAGKELSGSLYGALDEATLGIVVLSPELKAMSNGKPVFVSRPNVYQELGYLMHHLPRGRVIVFRERSVEVPSNIANFVHVTYEPNQIVVMYTELLIALRELGVFTAPAAFERAVSNHLKHLQEEVVAGRVSYRKVQWALKRLGMVAQTPPSRTTSAHAEHGLNNSPS